MKTIKFFIGITILTLISCQTEEIERNQNTELLSAEIKELSIFKLAAQMNNLALNEKLSNSEKVRLREFLIAILIMESFMIGVFCSLDLVVFYLFF